MLFSNHINVLGCLLKLEKVANGKMNPAILYPGLQTIVVFAEHRIIGREGGGGELLAFLPT